MYDGLTLVNKFLPISVLMMTWLQVRKRPLNKKELAKSEEDIVTIESQLNFLTVHETKFKVSTCITNAMYLLLIF